MRLREAASGHVVTRQGLDSSCLIQELEEQSQPLCSIFYCRRTCPDEVCSTRMRPGAFKAPAAGPRASRKRWGLGFASNASLEDAGKMQKPASHLPVWASLQALTPAPLPCRIPLLPSTQSPRAPQLLTVSLQARAFPQDSQKAPRDRARRRGWRRR